MTAQLSERNETAAFFESLAAPGLELCQIAKWLWAFDILEDWCIVLPMCIP